MSLILYSVPVHHATWDCEGLLPVLCIFCIYLPDLTNTVPSSILTNYIVHSSAANPHPLGSHPRALLLLALVLPPWFFCCTCNSTSVSMIMACSGHMMGPSHLQLPQLEHRPVFRDRSPVFRSAQPSQTMKKPVWYTYRQLKFRIVRPAIRLRKWYGGQRGRLTCNRSPPNLCCFQADRAQKGKCYK